MSDRTKRVLLILLAVGCGSGIVCLICGVFGAMRFQEWGVQLQHDAQITNTEADEFARTHDQLGCRDEGLRRGALCGQTDVSCIAQMTVFTDRCMGAATPTPGLCDGVPAQTDIMASASWAAAECAELGHTGDQRCPSVMQSIQRTCAHP